MLALRVPSSCEARQDTCYFADDIQVQLSYSAYGVSFQRPLTIVRDVRCEM
ncbi:MAG: hypothetical protein ETSY1_17070 [Candidatus Entotheonella factor]|uniref:Uncharacterized protein n=1 Tax=Entotheonella factor TaxID=1429438 RepID=W4LLU3_ENTF1|nr:MAG: hypothetical protein ETSY1_17070 [Candidatus Entotheonella factor]